MKIQRLLDISDKIINSYFTYKNLDLLTSKPVVICGPPSSLPDILITDMICELLRKNEKVAFSILSCSEEIFLLKISSNLTTIPYRVLNNPSGMVKNKKKVDSINSKYDKNLTILDHEKVLDSFEETLKSLIHKGVKFLFIDAAYVFYNHKNYKEIQKIIDMYKYKITLIFTFPLTRQGDVHSHINERDVQIIKISEFTEKEKIWRFFLHTQNKTLPIKIDQDTSTLEFELKI